MDEESGIKIIDRRRFDSLGEEREEGFEAVSKGEELFQKPQETPTVSKEDSSRDSKNGKLLSEEEISFSSLVMSLGTQTLMQLGEMDSQSGLAVPVDLEGAKQTIEILGMLQKKTKGNLSNEEAQLLENVLHNLKLGFVKVSQRKKTA